MWKGVELCSWVICQLPSILRRPTVARNHRSNFCGASCGVADSRFRL